MHSKAVLYVAVPAALMAVFYTADPLSLKSKGLGDLVIFLMFGSSALHVGRSTKRMALHAGCAPCGVGSSSLKIF